MRSLEERNLQSTGCPRSPVYYIVSIVSSISFKYGWEVRLMPSFKQTNKFSLPTQVESVKFVDFTRFHVQFRVRFDCRSKENSTQKQRTRNLARVDGIAF
jgi:hypothetical protein